MAQVTKKKWRSGPRKVCKVAWGYTLQVNGKQVKKFNGVWSQEDAQNELAAAILKRDVPSAPETARASAIWFDEAIDRYLKVKAAEGKRSLRDDRLHLARLKGKLGADTPLAALTAGQISEYKTARANEKSRRRGGEQRVAAATVNRELAALRHLLRLAVEEWQVLDKAPMIRLLKEPQGRLRFLTEDEIARLLVACARKQSPYLLPIVTMAVNTGMRKSELLELEWERVDFARGVLLLEKTKRGRRREVPMNQAVYEALSALPGSREGRVFRKTTGGAWGSIRTAFDNACKEAARGSGSTIYGTPSRAT